MFEVTRELNRKLDEIIGRQERTLSLMSSLQAGGGVPVGKSCICESNYLEIVFFTMYSKKKFTDFVLVVTHQQPGQPPVQMIDTIRRHEVDTVIQNQNSILSTARDLM